MSEDPIRPSKPTGVTRRSVLPGAGGALAFTILPRHVLGGPARRSPSDKLNIAGVGIGGMGRNYVRSCESENIVALCDVDHDFAANTLDRYPNAKRYRDFRVMLEKEKEIDAVIIGTPDHTHAVIAMAAIQLGKHVYCAKPMTRTIYEARRVTKAAREAGVATQMSVQSCASEDACALAELLQSGAIGAVREAHVWTDRPVWPQGLLRPKETPTQPSSIDWDLWIGPAPMRPYHPLYHPFDWRGWYDFGTGALGDMALHTFHAIFTALNLTHPTSVSCSTTVIRVPAPIGQRDPAFSRSRPFDAPESLVCSAMLTWDFPARGDQPPVRLHWYDGGLKPQRPFDLDPAQPLTKEGSYFVGDRGSLLMDRISTDPKGTNVAKGLLPAAKFQGFTPPPKKIKRTIGHYEEWIAAAKGGPPANCNFEFASRLAETALLGVISTRTGKPLVWDAPNMRITNDADANLYINPPYRSGWSL